MNQALRSSRGEGFICCRAGAGCPPPRPRSSQSCRGVEEQSIQKPRPHKTEQVRMPSSTSFVTNLRREGQRVACVQTGCSAGPSSNQQLLIRQAAARQARHKGRRAPVDVDGILLANAVRARHGLEVVLGVPVCRAGQGRDVTSEAPVKTAPAN